MVEHFAADHSVFLDDDCLIKGVAGSILWKQVQDFVETGRECFNTRVLGMAGECFTCNPPASR